MTPCADCTHRKWLWGILYCVLGMWSGAKNEKICAEYRRGEKTGKMLISKLPDGR